MKVTAQHLEMLRAVLEPNDTPERRAAYLAGAFPGSELVRDLDKRYRWDLYWLGVRQGHALPDSTNGYTDGHIDTALRVIVPGLEAGS